MNPKNKSTEKPIDKVKSENITHQIPIQGSLGLLALGAKGLLAWRKAKKEAGFEK